MDINLNCPWNDHGEICGKRGSISDGTNGLGPWYCSDHHWRLKGVTLMAKVAQPMSYRERWYLERNRPYEPPKLQDFPPFACIGGSMRAREPGED